MSIHVTSTAADASPVELKRAGAIALDAHPEYHAAASAGDKAVRAQLDAAQRELGVNLRRVWQADFRSWREGYDDSRLAQIAAGYVSAWRHINAEKGPFVGLWGEEAGHLAKRIAFLLGKNTGVPVWFVIFIPLPGRMLVLEDARYRLDPAELVATEPTAAEREYAEQLLRDIRSSTVQFAVPRDMSFRPIRVMRFGRLLLERYVSHPPGHRDLYPFRFAQLYVRQRAASAQLRRHYRRPGPAPFVFYPAQHGSDAQITVRAPQWEDQLLLIEHLARSLPYGFELAVKEHPFEVGGLPAGALRGLLRRLPIRLLPPTMHAHNVLRAATAVATVNSTTGFEALFFGVPLVTFGHGPYRGLGLTHDVADPYETPIALLEAVHADGPAEEEVVRLIALLHRRSYTARPLGYDLGDENIRRHAEIFADLARRREDDA